MGDIENIKNVVASLRADVLAGKAGMDGVLSGLLRLWGLLADLDREEEPQRTPTENRASTAFFARKKRKEGNWIKPL